MVRKVKALILIIIPRGVHQTNPMEFHLKQECIFKYDHVKFTVHSCLQGRAISQVRLSQAKSEKGGKIKA